MKKKYFQPALEQIDYCPKPVLLTTSDQHIDIQPEQPKNDDDNNQFSKGSNSIWGGDDEWHL